MNGAEIIIKTAVAAGIDICFANPGTTEMPLVAALDTVPGIRAKLGLFEGCCTGAADGYGRMAEKPALTLLHMGPGLANGIANLHNAYRAGTPVVNIVGDHASWHKPLDAPLTMNIEALAGVIPGWQRTCTSVATASEDMAEAISAALSGQVSTLIVPHDIQWSDIRDDVIHTPFFSYDPIDEGAVQAAVECLNGDGKTLIILGGSALKDAGLKAAERIRQKTGCELFYDTFPARIERGVGRPAVKRVPYFPEHASERLAQYQSVITIGTKPLVSFFGYKDIDCRIMGNHQKLVKLNPGKQDHRRVLEYLADRVGAEDDASEKASQEPRADTVLPEGNLTGKRICRILAALQPEHAIIVEEAVTSGGTYNSVSAKAPPHSLLTLTGGSLGQGMPCAVGAALACPDRPVVSFQADGAGMYTMQSLWMQAREALNVTTLICSNRSYDILKMEYQRAGIPVFGKNAASLMSLDNPCIGWTKLSEGMGVSAVTVNSCAQLIAEMKNAFTSKGPHLIEMVL